MTWQILKERLYSTYQSQGILEYRQWPNLQYISKKNMESLALNCYERFKSWFGNMHFEHIVTKVTEQMVIESEGKLIRENIKPFVYNALRHTNACRKLSKM